MLEKILEEIDNLYVDETDFGIECNMENRSDVACDNCYECIKEACKNIIRKHMNEDTIIGINIDDERLWQILFDEACVEGEQAERIYAELRGISKGGWIPCEEMLPDNANHKGAICPKYRILTEYGETVGWYNPDSGGWYVLLWFMTGRFLESEIDFDRGDIPKVLFFKKKDFVLAWKPFEPYRPEKGEETC